MLPVSTPQGRRTMSVKRSGIGNAKNFSGAGQRLLARSRKSGPPEKRRSVARKNSGAAHEPYSAPDSAERLPAANNGTGSGTRDGSVTSAKKLSLEDFPEAFRRVIMAPALMKHESAAAYYQLACLVATELAPRDIIEWLWVKDFTDYTWDILRYRHF